MATLLEKLKQRKSQKQQANVSGGTETAAKILAAGSGKVSTTPTTLINTSGEQAVGQQVNSNMSQVANQGQVEANNIAIAEAAQKAKQLSANTNLEIGKERLTSQRTQKLADMRQQLKTQLDKIGLAKEDSAVQSSLFEMRLANDKYINQLTNDRTLQRAFNAKDRRRELLKLQLSDSMDTFRKELADRVKLGHDKIDWEKSMGIADIDNYISRETKKWQATQQTAIFEGAGKVGAAVASHYAGNSSETAPAAPKPIYGSGNAPVAPGE